jgi:hypothetical protein
MYGGGLGAVQGLEIAREEIDECCANRQEPFGAVGNGV